MSVLLIVATQIYSLVVITIWGTYKLLHAQMSLPGGKEILENEDQWTFGQIIPILLLIVPIATIVATIFDHARYLGPDDHPDGFPDEWCIASSHDPSKISGNTTPAYWSFQPGAAIQPTAIHSATSLLEDTSSSRTVWDIEDYLKVCHVKDYDGAPWLGVCVICECLCLLAPVGTFPSPSIPFKAS